VSPIVQVAGDRVQFARIVHFHDALGDRHSLVVQLAHATKLGTSLPRSGVSVHKPG
jgi:hypothetical protein